MYKDLYKNYTSTSMLRGINMSEEKMTRLCVGWFKRRIIPLLPSDKASLVLDMGCGYGRYVLALMNSGYTNTSGIDVSTEQVAYAKEKLGLTNITEADAIQYLQEKKDCYDCIIAFDVLEHFEIGDLMNLMHHANNALRRGGRLIIQVPNALAPVSPNSFWDITHRQHFTVHSMEQLLRNYGFSEIKHHEALPHIHGLISLTRRIFWRSVINPLISFYMLAAYGSRFGGIYTANLITVAVKQQ